MSDSKTDPLQIEGEHGVINIAAGDFYFNTKARGKRLMLNSLSSDARRVYACLEQATMGFKREKALTMDSLGALRPLTQADIADQTELKLRSARRGFDELDREGLAEKRCTDDGPLRKGKVEIYSWAVPHPKQKSQLCARARTISEFLPDSWDGLKNIANRLKIKVPSDISAEEMKGALALFQNAAEEAARTLQKAEKEAARILNGVSAQLRLNKEARTQEQQEERTSSSSAFSDDSNTVEPPPAKAEEEEEATAVLSPPQANPAPAINGTASSYDRFKATYPREQFDESKAKPLFEKLKPDEQHLLLEQLPRFLDCDLWHQQPRYIPFASNFLKERKYAYDPPHLLAVAAPANGDVLNRKAIEERASMQRVNNLIKAQQEARKRPPS